MSELNRPWSPTPWECWDESFEVVNGDRSLVIYVPDGKDRAAIADLPAWIEAHDEWKARAEKAECERDEWKDIAESLNVDIAAVREGAKESRARAEKAEAALAEIHDSYMKTTDSKRFVEDIALALSNYRDAE